MRSEPPTWIDARILPEEVWSRAWEAVGEPLRARLKTCLAALCQIYAPAAPPDLALSRTTRQGLTLCRTARPLDWVLVLFDGQCSAAQVLAAAAPARLMGVGRVLAGRVDGAGGFPAGVLCGLELAGVEEVLDLDPGQAAELAGHLLSGGSGLVLGVGRSGELDAALRSVPPGRAWQGFAPEAVHVLTEDGFTPDLDALAQAAHPARVLAVKGGFEALAAENPEAACLKNPGRLSGPGLRLGPGQEGSWAWPDLAPERFLSPAWSFEESGPGREG